MKPCMIATDPRPIKCIVWPDDSQIIVGRECTAIVAYWEGGQMDGAYYAVYNGDEITRRIPAYMVSVVYKQEATDETD